MGADDIRVRRVEASDDRALVRFYRELSPDSLRQRFHAATRGISRSQATDLAGVDHHRRDGFVAVAEGIVGHLMLEPDGESREEIAVAVSDRYQHQGVGTLLLAAGVASARLRGIRRIVAWVLPDNRAMRSLLMAAPHPIRIEWVASVLRCELDVSQAGRGRAVA